ncbi:MAG: flotillin-like FloA family protein, partial [Verrucomicrobiae bacterium]|nr:flotillin-like FloA family protein [Verrucomicrobiae bacterium]
MIEFIITAIAVIAALVILLILFKFLGIWLRARVAGAPVSMLNLVAMWLRKVPPSLIVDTRITAAKAGLEYTTDQLEAHFLARGNIDHVILALIAADKAGITLNFDRACAIDLAVKGTTKTVLEAVRTSINPAVIDCPGGGGKIDA